MPPAAATAAARRSTARRAAAPAPRRVSGSGKQARLAAGIRSTSPSHARRPARGGAVAAHPPLALRLGGALRTMADHRLIDRLIRGRMWIAIVGTGLIGIVFMQVSMLRMNAGIGASVEHAAKLERSNAALQASISELASSDRISEAATRAGMVRSSAATGNFLDASRLNLSRAVRGITPPDPTKQLAGAATAAPAVTETAVAATTQPGATQPGTTQAGASTTATQQTATPGATTATTQTGVAVQQPTQGQASQTAVTQTQTQGTQPQTTGTTAVVQPQTPAPNPNPGVTVGGGAAATGP